MPRLNHDQPDDHPEYDRMADRLKTWHRLVRAQCAARWTSQETAVTLLDIAIPALDQLGDDLRLARAIDTRARSRRATGDLEGAIDDALDLADRARSWQAEQDAPLAAQAAQRAELELARTQLLGEADHLAREAAVDPVTGVGTRRWLELQLDELSRGSSSVAAMMLDLDHFKAINDRHGHHLGDSVLGTAGELLATSVRRSDVVARYGGDEFVLLLTGTEEQAAVELAERIQGRFRSFEWTEFAEGLAVTPSIGIAHGQASTLRDLLRMADTALYEAKSGGRDQARVANPGRA